MSCSTRTFVARGLLIILVRNVRTCLQEQECVMFVCAQPDNNLRENFPSPPSRGAEGMEELTVLLPGLQVKALEEAAHQDGLTAGQFLRRLIRQALACSSKSPTC